MTTRRYCLIEQSPTLHRTARFAVFVIQKGKTQNKITFLDPFSFLLVGQTENVTVTQIYRQLSWRKCFLFKSVKKSLLSSFHARHNEKSTARDAETRNSSPNGPECNSSTRDLGLKSVMKERTKWTRGWINHDDVCSGESIHSGLWWLFNSMD